MLLIQEEWPARALLKAELEDGGWEVLGANTLRLALHLSAARRFRPNVIVVDAVGLSADSAELEALRLLRGRATLLLLQSNQYDPSETTALAPSAVLRRPFTVGYVADTVKRLQV